MKKIEMTLATSHLDDHGQILTLNALKSLVNQVNSSVIPLGVEHDPRVAPIGRILSARLTQLEDGHYAVAADAEVFEVGDKIPLRETGEIPLRSAKSEALQLSFDRAFLDEESQLAVREIESIFGSPAIPEEKKSLDPLAVLTIIGAFTLGGIASGFLKKLGEDAYDGIKSHLKNLMTRKKESVEEVLLVFAFRTEFKGHAVEADVILSNPSPNEIDGFLSNGLTQLDPLLIDAFSQNESIRKLVLSYSEGRLSIAFAVRRDGVPLFPSKAAKVSG